MATPGATPAGEVPAAAALEAALHDAEAALVQGDVDGAVAAATRAAEAAQALEARGEALPPAARERAAAAHARCHAIATAARDRLAEALGTIGRSEKAARAYARTGPDRQ